MTSEKEKWKNVKNCLQAVRDDTLEENYYLFPIFEVKK